jgi:prepilin-type N-terminal cleavage/methylation domain-containing protein
MTRTLPARPSRRGYTAVEVLLAMTVLLIGSAAVMSMQKVSIQANLDARKLDIANSIAHTWLERLSTDATSWTLPAQNVTGTNNFNNTKWLIPGGSGGQVGFGSWFLPTAPGSYGSPGAEGNSPAFDILGRDLDATDAANAVFCTHVKIDPLAFDASANPLLLRATVIVFWQKQLVYSTATPGGNCTAWFDVASDEAANPGTWHIIYATTAIRKNTVQ